MYDVNRVDDVAKRFTHLPSMGISNHRVKINLNTNTDGRKYFIYGYMASDIW